MSGARAAPAAVGPSSPELHHKAVAMLISAQARAQLDARGVTIWNLKYVGCPGYGQAD